MFDWVSLKVAGILPATKYRVRKRFYAKLHKGILFNSGHDVLVLFMVSMVVGSKLCYR